MADYSNRQLSMKRIGIDKTNSRIVGTTAVAAFLVVFFLVASYSLFNQLTHQNRVIKAKKAAVVQLKTNIKSSEKLITSYKVFSSASNNFISGSSSGIGARDGSNPKITLDALPSKYDFPALTASLEKVVAEENVVIEGITGSDDEVAQSSQASNSPKPVEIPFEIKLEGDYAAIQRVTSSFERSIRPIQVQSLTIAGGQDKLSLNIKAKTFYQPEKTLKIRMKEVK